MATGLAYLHGNNIMHGNFFPVSLRFHYRFDVLTTLFQKGNVMLADDETVVITDTGFYAIEAAADMASGKFVPRRCSEPYKPPEEFCCEPEEEMQKFFKPSKNSDTYSFAASAYAVSELYSQFEVLP